MDEVTVYATNLQAVRRTADDCRRMISLLNAFGVKFSTMDIDTPEARAFLIDLLTRSSKPPRPLVLPLCFVGPVLVGSYEEMSDANEEGELPALLRGRGYAGPFRHAVHNNIAVGRANFSTAHATAAKEIVHAQTNSNVEEKEEKENEKEKEEKEEKEEEYDDEEPPPPPPDEEGDEVGSAEDRADSALQSVFSDSDTEHHSKEDHTKTKSNIANDHSVMIRKEKEKEKEEEEEEEPPPPPPSDDDEDEMESDEEPPPPPPEEDED